MKSCRPVWMAVLGAVLLAAGASDAFAVIANPSFEQGKKKKKVPDWDMVGSGNALKKFGPVVPTDGKRQVTLRTNQKVNQRKKKAADIETLEQFIGATLSVDAFDGSAYKQTFFVEQDSELSFDWTFGNNVKGQGGNDVAFAVLDGEVYIFAELDDLVFVNRHKKLQLTETQTFTLPEILEIGEHTLSIGIVNMGTGTGRSVLFLDNLILTAVNGGGGAGGAGGGNSAVNPEPLTAGLTMMSLGAMALTIRRRRHAVQAQ